jgi:hypothetical protein
MVTIGVTSPSFPRRRPRPRTSGPGPLACRSLSKLPGLALMSRAKGNRRACVGRSPDVRDGRGHGTRETAGHAARNGLRAERSARSIPCEEEHQSVSLQRAMQRSEPEANVAGRRAPCGPRAAGGAGKTNVPEQGVAQTSSAVGLRCGTGGGEAGVVEPQPQAQGVNEASAGRSARWQQCCRAGRTRSQQRPAQQHTRGADMLAPLTSRASHRHALPASGWMVSPKMASQQTTFGRRRGETMNAFLRAASAPNWSRTVGIIG